jgi:hypothetical protein
MKKLAVVQGIISAAVLSLIAVGSNNQVANAQRAVFLLDYKCVNTGNGDLGRDTSDVSVGRELYTSIMYMRSYSANSAASMTCRVNATESATLRLEFGIADNNRNASPSIVSVYLDGNQVAAKSVAPSQFKTLLVDLKGAKSLALETTCSRASDCANVYFFKAQIEGAASPGTRN